MANALLSSVWFFGVGLAMLIVVGAAIGLRLPREYRLQLRPSIRTVALIWTFYAVHFALIVLAAFNSTWYLVLPAPMAMAGGGGLIAAGLTLYLGGTFAFGSVKRLSGVGSGRLVTGGIYRWSRNPQVLGWTLLLAGTGIVRGSAMVVLLAAVFFVSYRLQLPLEEELLKRIHGDAYVTYSRRTHRYFGFPAKYVDKNEDRA